MSNPLAKRIRYFPVGTMLSSTTNVDEALKAIALEMDTGLPNVLSGFSNADLMTLNATTGDDASLTGDYQTIDKVLSSVKNGSSVIVTVTDASTYSVTIEHAINNASVLFVSVLTPTIQNSANAFVWVNNSILSVDKVNLSAANDTLFRGSNGQILVQNAIITIPGTHDFIEVEAGMMSLHINSTTINRTSTGALINSTNGCSALAASNGNTTTSLWTDLVSGVLYNNGVPVNLLTDRPEFATNVQVADIDGLGNSATRNVGTLATEVSQGDHSHGGVVNGSNEHDAITNADNPSASNPFLTGTPVEQTAINDAAIVAGERFLKGDTNDQIAIDLASITTGERYLKGIQGTQEALAGTGTPSAGNLFITEDSDKLLSADERAGMPSIVSLSNPLATIGDIQSTVSALTPDGDEVVERASTFDHAFLQVSPVPSSIVYKSDGSISTVGLVTTFTSSSSDFTLEGVTAEMTLEIMNGSGAHISYSEIITSATTSMELSPDAPIADASGLSFRIIESDVSTASTVIVDTTTNDVYLRLINVSNASAGSRIFIKTNAGTYSTYAYNSLSVPVLLAPRSIYLAMWDAGTWNYRELGGAAISNPNFIINGDFGVSQRGEGTFTSGYGIDMVIAPSIHIISTWGRGSDTDRDNFLTWDHASGAGDDYFYLMIENYNLMNNKTVTVSFDVKSTYVSPIESIAIGGASGGFVSGVVGNSGNTWQRRSLSFSVPQLTGVYAFLRFDLTPGVFHTTSITNVKLELGSVATPFIPDDPAVSLAKCQRYLRVYGGGVFTRIPFGGVVADSASAVQGLTSIPDMRVIPSISQSGNWKIYNAGDSIPLGTMSIDPVSGFMAAAVSGATIFRAYRIEADNDATARIILSAEL